MEIKYSLKSHNCKSTLEASYALEGIKTQVNKLIDKKLRDYIKNSPVDIYITIIGDPSTNELENAHMHNSKVYSVLSEKLLSDVNFYTFRNRLGSISIGNSLENCLIAIGLSEFSIKQTNSGQSNEEDEDKPIFIAKEPKYTLEDVLLSNEAKEKLMRALSIIENKELIFDKWGFSKIDKATKSIICFYGPAGTGKTMTAEAIGAYLGKKIVHSSYAQIESQWVGVGAKNLHAIFNFAAENDAVLFFDEADSFLSSRIEATKGGSDKHYNRMSNELFQLLEDFNGCVVFATNLLTDVDAAFKSRIIDSIKFELPDLNDRVKLIKLMLPAEFPLEEELTEEALTELADIADGFSGRDIRKSILLSLAEAAIQNRTKGSNAFGLNELKAGFLEVRDVKEKMLAEQGFIPNEVVDNLLSTQKKNEHIVDMAIYAMYSDGELQEEEQAVLNELSKGLLGTPIETPIKLPEISLQEICSDSVKNHWEKEILDVAIRIIASDCKIDECENAFLSQVMGYLNISEEMQASTLNYVQSLADTNILWKEIAIKL